MITKSKLLVLLTLLSFSFPQPIVQSQVQNVNLSQSTRSNSIAKGMNTIDWNELDLSKSQMETIQKLDEDWSQVEQLIRPKIIRDQQQLKNVMGNPDADENLIRKLQNDIMLRQKQLRYEATENFLSKRRVLSPDQRKKLHQQMIQK